MNTNGAKIIGIKLGTPYGVLNKQFIQFDPQFRIGWSNGDIEIHLSYNDDEVPGFFGDTVDYISGIVGKNGVGKSTLIKYVKNLFMKESQNLQERENDVILFQEGRTIYAYVNERHRGVFRFGRNDLGLKNEVIYYRGYPKIFDRLRNFTTVFYSNSLDQGEREVETTNFFNISTNYLSENIGKINKSLKNKKIRNQSGPRRFRFTELMRQIEFVNMLENNERNLDIPFKTISEISLIVDPVRPVEYARLISLADKFIKENIENHNQRLKVEQLLQNIKQLQKEFERVRKELRFTSKGLYLNILENFNLYLVKSFFELKNFLKKVDILGSVFEIFTMPYNDEVDFYQLREQLEYKFNRSADVLEHLISIGDDESYMQFREQLNINRSFLHRLIDLVAEPDRNSENVNISSRDPRLGDFLRHFFGTSYDFSFINFVWPSLSAGEASLIAFFSRMQAIIEDIRSENIMLLIDEGDLYFHPEWQRDYIYFLLEFFRGMIDQNRQISIILTTHSPFLLSDLPSDNVILLIRNENNLSNVARANQFEVETFGGNIHTLFSKAFFLDESTVSRFAREKIKREIIEPLRSGGIPTNGRKIEKLINKVGEPVLQLALKELFEKRYDSL